MELSQPVPPQPVPPQPQQAPTFGAPLPGAPTAGATTAGAPMPGAPAPVVPLRVTKNLLWVGEAAYPLRNLARVYTVDVVPRRAEAWRRYWWRAGTLFALLVLTLILAPDGTAGALFGFWLTCTVPLMIYFTVRLLIVIKAQDHFVLFAETCGKSTAMVTTPDRAQLRGLAYSITEAIDNPAAEFEVQVQSVNINPRIYHTGDNVNMYGGIGNTGVAR